MLPLSHVAYTPGLPLPITTLKTLPKEIPILNTDRSENKGGKIQRYLKTTIEVAR